MKRKWTIGALASAAVLLLALALPAFGSSSIYLMAVNDTVFPMTADNMPFFSGGTLYVPYTMFSSRDSGVQLGVEARYNATRGTVQVSQGGQGVTFYLRSNTAYDLEGNAVSARAATRNSMPFVPLAWVSQYFGTVDYTITQTAYGVLVRVTNSAAVLNIDQFLPAAERLLRGNIERYLESIATPEPTPTPTPVPTPTPTPAPPPEESESGAQPSQPVLPDTVIFFGLRWDTLGEAAASALEEADQRGLFLFTVEELTGWDDEIRRLAAEGHTLGLVLTGETAEECAVQADEGRALLAHIARCDALVVRAEGLDGEGQAALEETGLVVWRPGVDAGAAATGSGLLRLLDAGEVNCVELRGDERGLSALSGALNLTRRGGYELRQATAPALAALSGRAA